VEEEKWRGESEVACRASSGCRRENHIKRADDVPKDALAKGNEHRRVVPARAVSIEE
jgi:hypothetical protein